MDVVCLLLCISLEGIAVEGPGCSSGRGCSWEPVACAIEDLVWDEVVLNRGVEQIVPDGALPTPDFPNKSSISFEKTCKTM